MSEDGARTVEAAQWAAAVREARDAGFGFFDCLSVTDGGDGTLGVRLHLWDRTTARHCHLLTTVTGPTTARATQTAPGSSGSGLVLDSVADVFAGAGWHEREAAEMFGLRFRNAPDDRPLLLADGFVGHPLRKDFALASRAVQDWPGAHEPTEHGPAAKPPGRRRPTAFGVPDFADPDLPADPDAGPGPPPGGAP